MSTDTTNQKTESGSTDCSTLRECAERLVANCWDVYLHEPPEERKLIDVADKILFDGRTVANRWLFENPSDSNEHWDEDWLSDNYGPDGNTDLILEDAGDGRWKVCWKSIDNYCIVPKFMFQTKSQVRVVVEMLNGWDA